MTGKEAIARLTNVGLVAVDVGSNYVLIFGGVPLKAPSETVIYPFQVLGQPDDCELRCYLPHVDPSEEITMDSLTLDEAIERIIALYENCRTDWEHERDNIDPSQLRPQE